MQIFDAIWQTQIHNLAGRLVLQTNELYIFVRYAN